MVGIVEVSRSEAYAILGRMLGLSWLCVGLPYAYVEQLARC